MIIPLNIVREYPVDWDFPKILRDLVQNFYDEIGYENFAREFVYTWEEVDGFINLSMKTKGHSFRYEWLTYVGGSTKTDKDKQYIGMYGEGFKMCMLCLLRDFKLEPRMSSQNWSIVPCWEWITIGDTMQMALAYDLTERNDDGETTLTIEKIPIEYLDNIKCGMMDFYYPQNPLLGKLICNNENYIMHERSGMSIPCAQWDRNLKGIYFQTLLARGRLPFPIAIVDRQRVWLSQETRKRRTFYPFEVNNQIYHLATRMGAADSYQLLLRMREYWNDLPRERYDIYTWYYVVNQLVRNISKSSEYVELFRQENPKLVYVERKGIDRKKDKLIENALHWAREQGDDRYKVNPIFRLLNVPSLLEEYQKTEMECYRTPSGIEIERIRILQEVVGVAFRDFFDIENMPDIILVKEGEKNLGALTFAERCYGKKTHNRCNISYKYRIKKAVLEEHYLADECFEDALMNYIDILCHGFGTDRNANVNAMLTECGAVLVQHRDVIQQAKKKWMEIDNAGI